MKHLTLAIVLAGIMLILNGCAVYGPPYAYPAAYGGYGFHSMAIMGLLLVSTLEDREVGMIGDDDDKDFHLN